MNIPLPDSGIPVQPGDDHFKYKGVYHPITWINDIPYRPRVETLVIMGGNMVYVRLKDGDKLGSSGNGESYELPGGSIDADSSPIKQAENEINEEALISVKNIYDTGIQYYADYPSGFLMNGGDTPLEYAGHISSVFVAEYNGIHDRNSVEKKDLDPKISENGKFYLITQVVPYLRQEHIDALLNSPYVKDSVKGAIRILNRKTNPSKKEYQLLSTNHVVGDLFFVSKDSKMETIVGSKYKNSTLHIDTGETPIIRIFNSIEEALTGYDSVFGRLKSGDTVYVYSIDDKIESLYTPNNQESPSSKITGELWIKTKRPVKVKRLGLVRVSSDGTEDKYYYGKNSTLVGSVLRLKYDWVTKDMGSTGCMESSIVLPKGNKLYHGSTYLIGEFEPMSLDLGNAQQEPGWSTFTFANYTFALRFGLMRAVQKVKEYYGERCKDVVCSWSVEDKKPFISADHFKLIKSLIEGFKYYVYTIDPTDLDVGIGNDEKFPEYTFRESGVFPEKTDVIKIDDSLLNQNLLVLPMDNAKEYYEKQERYANGNKNRGWYSVMMTKDYNNGLASAQLQKAIKDGELRPGDDIELYMRENGIAFDDDSISMREYSSVTESLRLPGKLYHGSTCKFDELRPTGIDFGNTFQEPGWSLFTWTKIDSAIGWAIFCVIKKLDISHYGCMNSQTTILPESSYDKLNENINKLSTSDKTFYVYTIKPESDFEFGLGHSSNTPNCITIRRDHIKPIDTTKYILTMELVDKYCKVVPDDYKPTLKEQGINKRLLSVFMKYDFMYQPKLKKQLSKDVKSGKLSVGDDLREYLINNNFDLKEVSIIDRLLSRDAATDTTLEKIKKFHFELSSFDYFIVQEDGTIDYTTSDYMVHRTLTPSQFEKYKGGICWDYVQYQVDYFKKHFKSVKTKSFFHVFINDKDQPTHTFMLFYLNHKVYYFECSWKPMMGIYEFSSEADALSYIVSELYKGLSPDQRDCVYDKYTLEYNPLDTSLFGLNCVDYMNYMGNKIDKNQGICKYIENKLVRPAVIQKTTVRVENNKPIVSVTEACKNINEARKFVSEVGKLAKKYDANYFIVTDGASGISNKGNLAVRHARNCQIEWEKERGFDPYEDWSKSKITEAAEYSSVNKYPVFIALMHTGTNMSKTVRTVTHDEFTHATIAFNSKLNPLYSFGTKNFPGNDHGFVIQEPTSDFYRHYKSKYSVFVMYVSKEQRDKMLNRLQYFIDNADSFKFDIAALVACALKIPTEFRKKFFCSRFCMEIIGQGIELEKVPSLWSPQQMSELNNISLVNKGDDFYKYDYRITEKNLKKIKSGKLDDIVLENNLKQGDDVYYRVTFNGVGIYEAYKSMVSEDTWRRFKASSACSWLPAPMSYGFGYKSYFTKQGIDNFKTFTLLKIAKTIPLNMIKIEEVVIRKSRSIVYQDTFQIIVYEPTKLKESTLLEVETPRSELPDNEFGLPSERKYPLDSVSHVNSAIKFFNYVSKDDEEELANNIIKKINEYDMTGKLSVTTKNRIYPYLTSAGLMESLSETDDVILNDYIMNLPTNLRRRTMDKLSEYRKENRLYENKMYVEGRLVSIVMAYQDPVDVTTAHVIIMCIDGTNQSTIKDLTDDIILGLITLHPDIETLRLLDVVSNNYTTVSIPKVKENISSVTESWIPLMEASDDDEAATDYTAEADTDDATDYTEEADTSDNEDSDDSQEETASDYTEDANTDESEEDTTDNGSENENSDTSGEDPLNGGEDLSATDYTDEAGSSDNADGGDSSDTSSTSEIPRNGNLIDNNVLKNYSVLTNFEKLYNLTKEVSDSMDSVVMPTKLQNTVLAQALKNLNSIKEFILSYVKFQFSSDNYAQNLYYYNIVLQTLNLNLEILKRNKDLGETKNDSKKSRR